ncbi:hypothetical protein ACFWPY_19630, partial [Streptomyces sp. NPDC058527]
IIAGITWILSLLNPASAFIRAVKGIIDIVTFIVTQGAQIADFVNAVLDAVIHIANGGAAGVPKTVETALAASIPLLIGLLASLLGIGGLANKVKSVFQAVSKPVNRAIDKIVDFIAKKGKSLWQKLKTKGKEPGGSAPDRKDDNSGGLKTIRAHVSLTGSDHTVTAKPTGEVRMASQEGRLQDKVRSRLAAIEHITPYPHDEKNALETLLRLNNQVAKTAKEAMKSRSARKEEAWGAACHDLIDAISDYGQRFNKRDIEGGVEDEEQTQIAKKDRRTSPELQALALRHKGADCVAILRTSGGTYEGWSSDRSMKDLNQAAVKQISRSRPKHHYGCAEVLCISQAYDAEYGAANPEPTKSATIEMVHASGKDFGKPYPACMRCSPLLRQLGILVSN